MRTTTTTIEEPRVIPPERAIHVTGSVRLVLVINLGSFVEPADAELFRHWRGSEAYAEAVRGLHPHAPFVVDTAHAEMEQAAYGLRIFRSRLIHNHFFPTYRIGWDEGMRARLATFGCIDVYRWQRWTGHLRLTRNGLAVITLEQPLEDLSLLACTEQVLELAEGNQSFAQDQWTLGMVVLNAFLDAIGRTIRVECKPTHQTVRFATSAHAPHSLRLDRYIVYSFGRFERDGVLLSPELLKAEYAPTLAAFMEGALVECDGERRYPRYGSAQAEALAQSDVSTWDEELCLFSGESALIYCPLVERSTAYLGGPHGLNAHAYRTYWAGILRGIEHLVALRSEAQQVERRTTDLLTHVPALTRKVTDGHLSMNDTTVIDQLAGSVADIFGNLPELRSMALSTAAFRADYVRQKFESLMCKLAIQDTLDLVNINVEQLNFFLSYYNDMRLQWQGNKTNALGITLGIIVGFMAISSFLADTFTVIDNLNTHQHIIATLAVVMVGLAVLALAVYTARRYSRRQGWQRRNQ